MIKFQIPYAWGGGWLLTYFSTFAPEFTNDKILKSHMSGGENMGKESMCQRCMNAISEVRSVADPFWEWGAKVMLYRVSCSTNVLYIRYTWRSPYIFLGKIFKNRCPCFYVLFR